MCECNFPRDLRSFHVPKAPQCEPIKTKVNYEAALRTGVHAIGLYALGYRYYSVAHIPDILIDKASILMGAFRDKSN